MRMERLVGGGLSLRIFGFRIDSAWPIDKFLSPKHSKDGVAIVRSFTPRIHLGIDVGA
jgi:hypothetical protein